MPSDRKRIRPDYGEILNQDGKVFYGELNPGKKNGSLIKWNYKTEDGTPICSAFRTDGQRICTVMALMENGRCKKHGGASLVGSAAPGFKTGRFSRSLPVRLASRYEEALADTELADFTEDLAIIDSRLDDLFQQLDAGGGKEIFNEIKEAYRAFRYANQDGDKQAQREALRRLDENINRGSGESYLWTEIASLQEQRRKIILAQAKHLSLTNQTITVAKANVLISALLDAVRRNVDDRGALHRINQDFLRLTNGGGTRQLEAQNA
jgi:hypothetical protein